MRKSVARGRKPLAMLFSPRRVNGHGETSRSMNLLGRINRNGELCYSIDEADSRSGSNFAIVLATGTSGQNALTDQSFNVGRGFVVPSLQEVSANEYDDGKVDPIGISGVCLRDDYVRGNHLREVVHDHTCKDLLNVTAFLRCPETDDANCSRIAESAVLRSHFWEGGCSGQPVA
jgi:hypothetical protein